MKKFEWGYHVGNERLTKIVEFEDDATHEEIMDAFNEWLHDRVDAWSVPVGEEKAQ